MVLGVSAAVLTVLISTGIVAVIIAGSWSLVYAGLYVFATIPGWPVGRALFGRSHPAGWISGAIIGYGLTCIAFWAVLRLRLPSAPAFLIAWAVTTAATWSLVRIRQPLLALPAWGQAETRALLLLLLLVPAVFLLPYKNLGAQDESGNRYYRAYFTADFVWHTALTAELAKYDMPPRNPYMGDRTIQYYWTYFLVPAVIAREGPAPLRDVESALKLNALFSGVLFIAALIVATRCASNSGIGTAIAVGIAVLAASAEGLYASWDIVSRGRSLNALKDLNVDALTAWEFRGLRVDSLVRSMWYNPQHSMSAALGLLAMPIAGSGGVMASRGAIVCAGIVLALATTFNPLIGGLFLLIYGTVVAADAIRVRRLIPLLWHIIAAALVALAVAWCVANDMVEGAAGVVLYGFGGYARNAPVTTMVLSLGPLLVPAVVALWPPTKLPRDVWPSVAGVILGVLVFYFVRLSVEGSYIGFRAGQLLQLVLPGLAALFFARLWQANRRSIAIAAAATIVVIGLPTTLIDSFNTQDIHNRGMGPGFRWTITVTPDEQEAFRWLRTQTPPTAIVQMDPVAHGRETWSQLPTFAQRRMAAARPISLMNVPEYDRRSRQVHTIYAGARPEEAAQTARALGINYIFVGPAETKSNRPDRLEKFDKRPDLFKKVFQNGMTRIYEVLDRS
jgi:hypothetical protein